MNLFSSILFCKRPFLTFNNWLDEYLNIVSDSALSKKTISEKLNSIVAIKNHFGDVRLNAISSNDINIFINSYVEQDKDCAARNFYFLLKDIFYKAQVRRYINNNPVLLIRPPKPRVKRCRLSIEEFFKIYHYAKSKKYRKRKEYVHQSLLLALVSGQRREDLVNMRRVHIKSSHLHIDQQKGARFKKIKGKIVKIKDGSLIALPLRLKLKTEVNNFTLRKTVKLCSGIDYLLENQSKKISPSSLTQRFAEIRDKIFKDEYWQGFTPPSFHEIRALSERLYREQGVDTQTLLGHKYKSTTDLYSDTRGRVRKYLKLVSQK